MSVTNSLANLFPKIAREWNRSRNGDLAPAEVLGLSNDLAWWRCPVGHEWRARVPYRTAAGKACPLCAGDLVKASVYRRIGRTPRQRGSSASSSAKRSSRL